MGLGLSWAILKNWALGGGQATSAVVVTPVIPANALLFGGQPLLYGGQNLLY